MMRRATKTLLWLALTLPASQLYGQTAGDITVTRPVSGGGEFYIGGVGGLADYDEVGDSDVGAGLFGGYAFTEVFAAELGWLDLGEAERGDVTAEVSVVYLSVIGSLNLRADASVFAKLGVLEYDSDTADGGDGSSDSGSEGLLGLGAAYGIGGQSSLRFAIDFIPVDREDIVFYSVGFVQRF